jgi:hypothetical protein
MKHSFVSRLINYFLGLSLLGLAVFTAATMTFGSPDSVKQALRDSGAYKQAASLLADRASQEAAKAGGASLESMSVDSAARSSISPELIQRDGEGAIDNTYAWLQGQTPSLKISIDLTPYINSFTGRLGDQAVQQASALPDCTIQQLQQLNLQHANVFDLPCKPTGVNLNTLKEQAVTQLTKSSDLLGNPVASTDSLPKDDRGKTALDHAKDLPQVFQWSMLLPWACAIAALVFASLIILLSRPAYHAGLRLLSRSLLGAGITVLVLVTVAKLFFWYATRPDGVFSRLVAGNFSEVILSFARSLEKAYDSRLLIFGIGYTILGLAGIFMARFLKGSTTEVSSAKSDRPEPAPTPSSPPAGSNTMPVTTSRAIPTAARPATAPLVGSPKTANHPSGHPANKRKLIDI